MKPYYALSSLLVCPVSMMAAEPQQSSKSPDMPNIILMMADDCTHRDLGCYGSTNSITPNIDRLASEGLRFTNFFQATAMSSPTRHCMMTGLYPVKSGAYPNHTYINPGVQTVVQYMRQLGYRTALQGKRHINPESAFDFEYLGKANEDVKAKKIKAFIDDCTAENTPFCLFVCSQQPHTPWDKGDTTLFDPDKLTLPPFYVDTEETRRNYVKYLAEINYMDNQVGEVMKALEESGTADNTIFFFTSEQGNSFPFVKWTCYDMGLQTAMIVRWRGVIEPGSECDALAEYVDITPTFIDIAGGKAVKGLDGKSFLKVLQGKKKEFKKEVYAVHTSRGIISGPEAYAIRSVRTDRYAYIRNLNYKDRFCCVTTSGKDPVWNSWLDRAETDPDAQVLVNGYLSRPQEELYDRENDPYMMNNLADKPEYAGIKKALSKKLDAWMKSQGDKGVETEMEAKAHQVGALKKAMQQNKNITK